MKSFSLPVILNSLIVFVFSFFIILLPFGFVDLPPALRVIFSLAIAFTISFSVFYLLKDKENARHDKKCKKARKDEAIFTLNRCTKKEIVKIFGELLDRLNLSYEQQSGYFSTNGVSILPCFLPEELSLNELLSAYRNCPFENEKLIVISDKFSSAVNLKNLSVVHTRSIVALLDKEKLLPETQKPVKPKRNILKALFYKANGKKLILYGTCLICLGFFVFYPLYYFISGSIFIVYGLIALFFGNIKPVDRKDDLLFLLNKTES